MKLGSSFGRCSSEAKRGGRPTIDVRPVSFVVYEKWAGCSRSIIGHYSWRHMIGHACWATKCTALQKGFTSDKLMCSLLFLNWLSFFARRIHHGWRRPPTSLLRLQVNFSHVPKSSSRTPEFAGNTENRRETFLSLSGLIKDKTKEQPHFIKVRKVLLLCLQINEKRRAEKVMTSIYILSFCSKKKKRKKKGKKTPTTLRCSWELNIQPALTFIDWWIGQSGTQRVLLGMKVWRSKHITWKHNNSVKESVLSLTSPSCF